LEIKIQKIDGIDFFIKNSVFVTLFDKLESDGIDDFSSFDSVKIYKGVEIYSGLITQICNVKDGDLQITIIDVNSKIYILEFNYKNRFDISGTWNFSY